MATFKVGQRVKIDLPESRHHGKSATVISELILMVHLDSAIGVGERWVHCLDVDGVGTINWRGYKISYRPECLIPLADSGEKTLTAEGILALSGLCEFNPSPAIAQAPIDRLSVPVAVRVFSFASREGLNP